MSEQYVMCNGYFEVVVENGILLEVGMGRDPFEVAYVNEKKGFGDLYLTWEKDGEEKEWQPLRSGEFRDRSPCWQGRSLVYTGEVKGEDLEVTIRYLLLGEELRQEVLVRNSGRTDVRLLDFGLCFSCHTDFAWGRDAAKEVIGHHFVAGHGSHSTYYRCDGKGCLLTVMPAESSEWIYYDSPEKDTTIIYALNEAVSRKAREAGSRLRILPKYRELAAGECFVYRSRYLLAANYEDCRSRLVEHGQIVAESVPGYTVPREFEVRLCLRSQASELTLSAEHARITFERKEADRSFYRIRFDKLGEQCVKVFWEGCKYVELYYFITEPIKLLLQKRAAFIAGKQVRDVSKWYNGLFAEWNNETGVMLNPDYPDKIINWRIYEVTCDDPGLSKPAFLSSKQTVYPVQEEVDALDYYIEHFVWGGLQQKPEEAYPYGIYGIPDWHTLRHSGKSGNDGEKHLWRVYDYPHIALMYYNMYEVAAQYSSVKTKLSGETYLLRAYGTALALFQVPEELEGWSAYKTGLYNELVIPRIIEALRVNGYQFEAGRLENHWFRKVSYFVKECKNIFDSEYPFDTTGFESTHVLAGEAIKRAAFERNDSCFCRDIPCQKAWDFMENQTECNVACRGLLEPAYFWYGSDYRGNNMQYTLSYMSQMGACSLLDYACYYAQDPFGILRLAYGSLLSSWALMNTGDEESKYGYWFPGKEHDGCAGGGFEPLYLGETWLEQPHTGGSWYYSCEIDLGFCGGFRGAAAILAEDPLFGTICYGGILRKTDQCCRVDISDGVQRRFHYITKDKKLHVELQHGQFTEENSVEIAMDLSRIELRIKTVEGARKVTVKLLIEGLGDYEAKVIGLGVENQGESFCQSMETQKGAFCQSVETQRGTLCQSVEMQKEALYQSMETQKGAFYQSMETQKGALCQSVENHKETFIHVEGGAEIISLTLIRKEACHEERIL